MIDELLWVLWTIGQVAAVMVGWFVIISVALGLLRGAREAVQTPTRRNRHSRE